MKLTTSSKQNVDAASALVLILLIVALFTQQWLYLKMAIVVLLVQMTVPNVFAPWAWFWFGLSKVLGGVMSKIILTIIFLLIVVPVGVIRRWSGKDSLQLKQFAKSTTSVFKIRSITITSNDITNPF